MMQIKMFAILFAAISAGSIRRTQKNQIVRLYSSKTGRHLTIDNERVSSTEEISNEYSDVQFVQTGLNQFAIQGVKTGFYIKRSSSRRALKVTSKLEKAAIFTQKDNSNDNYSVFKLVKNEKCKLIIKNNGKPSISCNDNKNDSFLPRHVHHKRA